MLHCNLEVNYRRISRQSHPHPHPNQTFKTPKLQTWTGMIFHLHKPFFSLNIGLTSNLFWKANFSGRQNLIWFIHWVFQEYKCHAEQRTYIQPGTVFYTIYRLQSQGRKTSHSQPSLLDRHQSAMDGWLSSATSSSQPYFVLGAGGWRVTSSAD